MASILNSEPGQLGNSGRNSIKHKSPTGLAAIWWQFTDTLSSSIMDRISIFYLITSLQEQDKQAFKNTPHRTQNVLKTKWWTVLLLITNIGAIGIPFSWWDTRRHTGSYNPRQSSCMQVSLTNMPENICTSLMNWIRSLTFSSSGCMISGITSN